MRSAKAGFTIIEMMIAMTILAFIALAVYQNTTQSFVLRESVEQEGDFYNSIRVALDVLGRDIVHIYTPQAQALPGELGKAEVPKPAGQGQPPSGTTFDPNNAGAPSKFWAPPINSSGVKPTRLQGESSKLSFIISSHMRLFRDTAESDFAKIWYTLEDDKLADKDRPSGKVLVKHEDLNAFNEEDSRDSETETKYQLLTGIKSLEFEYLDGEKDRWDKRWDTSGMEHKNVFPTVIKVTVEVYMPNSENTFKIVQQFRPELPI